MSGRRRQQPDAPRPLPVGMPALVAALAARLQALPGVGEKAAQRHAIWLATGSPDVAKGLSVVLASLHAGVGTCERCGGLATHTDAPRLCDICRDGKRDAGLLCVVARVQDLMAIERSGAMRGRYFVLGRLLSPLDGITAADLPIQLLRLRVADGVREVVLALPASVDGAATAFAVGAELVHDCVKITRLAIGVSHGADLEYADALTLSEAIRGRKDVTT